MQESKQCSNKKQIGFSFLVFAIIYFPTLLFLGCIVIAAVYFGIEPSFFARDPVVTLGGHYLTGLQSHLGVLVLFATSAICFFCFGVLRFTPSNKVFCSFLLWSGAIAGFLALDDLLLFHEHFFPTHLGLGEKKVLAIYGIGLAIYLIKFRKVIYNFEPLLLFLALIFFGLSIFIDEFLKNWNSIWRIFLEDGFKLLGIASWSGYLIRICLQTIVKFLNVQQLINNIQPDTTAKDTQSKI